MKKLLSLTLLFAGCLCAPAQDAVTLVDDAPLVSVVLLKTLEKCAPFSASVQVTVSDSSDPAPSTATGSIEYDHGSVRWNVRLTDVRSPQLSQSARAAVRQINGEQFVVISSQNRRANFLVLSGSRAYLEQPLPAIKLLPARAKPTSETIDGRVCSKELVYAVQTGGGTNQVQTWKAKELKGVPSVLQVSRPTESIRIRFADVQFRPISPDEFTVPQDFSRYNSFEDLIQSVLISKVKRRIGLE